MERWKKDTAIEAYYTCREIAEKERTSKRPRLYHENRATKFMGKGRYLDLECLPISTFCFETSPIHLPMSHSEN